MDVFTHYILTATSYSKHTRVAFDLAVSDEEKAPDLRLLEEVKARNTHGLPTSFHMKSIEDASIEKLIETDPYFEGVHFCKSVDEFIAYLESDLCTSSKDIGKYILSMVDCSKLKLQKLVYYCYAEYLKKTGRKLFKDPVYAFQYGPVSEDLYRATTSYDREMLRKAFLPDFDEKSHLVCECRMARTEDGKTKILVIQDVVDRYGDLSAEDLVNMTHRPGSPWSRSWKNQMWTPITDSTILQCHAAEVL